MTAPLLGGAGFIGLHLARRLAGDGHEVCVVDDFSRGRNDRAGRVVHIGDDTAETGIGDLAKLVLRVTGGGLEPVPGAPGSVDRRCPDLTLLRALTGYRPAVELEEGVRRTVEWYRRWAAL
ncbi:NAD-dependent epimerase/dehydratase family protein [Dactylosporangium sp. CA-092794]|uniref:NAD-dependent epimerase/dehydratase family protein n=1 Tax=Dactylosporangium sp. CA-092794 TaxID=3239929 RepID=UPI003D917AFB